MENTANRCGRLKKAVDDRMQLMHLWNIWKAYVARNKQLRNLVRIAVDKFQNTGVVKRVMREWHVLTLRAKMDALRREFETRLAHATGACGAKAAALPWGLQLVWPGAKAHAGLCFLPASCPAS